MLRQPTISTRTDNLLPYRTLFRSRGQVMEVVRAAFRPEFLNRLDEILLFRRLSREDMTGIVDIQLQRLQALLAERKITLELDDRARAWLADAGYDPVYGARPLRRATQPEVHTTRAGRRREWRVKGREPGRGEARDDSA